MKSICASHASIKYIKNRRNNNQTNHYPSKDIEIVVVDTSISAQTKLAFCVVVKAHPGRSNLHKGKGYILQTNCHCIDRGLYMINASRKTKITFQKFVTGFSSISVHIIIPFVFSVLFTCQTE
jgi:hypothetical protein